MARGQRRDALRKEKFWFRRDITSSSKQDGAEEYTEFTINEIINGKVLNQNTQNKFLWSLFNVKKYCTDIF